MDNDIYREISNLLTHADVQVIFGKQKAPPPYSIKPTPGDTVKVEVDDGPNTTFNDAQIFTDAVVGNTVYGVVKSIRNDNTIKRQSKVKFDINRIQRRLAM